MQSGPSSETLIILVIPSVTHIFIRSPSYDTADTSQQTTKSATIEMYAPSSYNDTMTGETLSSVSEKSDSYSNDGSHPDYMVSPSFYLCVPANPL